MRATEQTINKVVTAEVSSPSSYDVGRLRTEQTEIAAVASGAAEAPLCVDLDGTVVRTDLAWECILSLFKSQPLALFLIPAWLLQGMARTKRELAERVKLDVTALPYRGECVSFLTEQREQGRQIGLVTAADDSLAKKGSGAPWAF